MRRTTLCLWRWFDTGPVIGIAQGVMVGQMVGIPGALGVALNVHMCTVGCCVRTKKSPHGVNHRG